MPGAIDKDNLVISVSLDSSLELLEKFADIIVLDRNSAPSITQKYETVYIRSHFGTPGYTPTDFRKEIADLVADIERLNPNVTFIDSMSDVDTIVRFEDKWSQHQSFSDFMPRTEVYSNNTNTDVSSFRRPIFKKRLSSRGQGITWDIARVDPSTNDWLIQESLDVDEELRVYIVKGHIFPIATVRQNMTENATTQAISSRELTKDEFIFSTKIAAEHLDLDMIGLDIAITPDNKLYLMEANRSPGFAKFHALTGINLAIELYAKALEA